MEGRWGFQLFLYTVTHGEFVGPSMANVSLKKENKKFIFKYRSGMLRHPKEREREIVAIQIQVEIRIQR